MSFTDLKIPLSVSTTERDPIETFFVPVLEHAVQYDFAIGFFTTQWIRDAAKGIASLATKRGKSRWIISPFLTNEDWLLLNNPENYEEIVHELICRDIDQLIRNLELATRTTIAWLIKDGILDFRIAVPTNKLKGMFHAKFGIFTDEHQNRIAFSGSYNLTGAAATNWEHLDVFSSEHKGDEGRIIAKQILFERMWSNTDTNLRVYKPRELEISFFEDAINERSRPYNLRMSPTKEIVHQLQIPSIFLNHLGKLRDHQESAINGWFSKNGRGIFNMATGSGKTVTALSAAVRLCHEIERRNGSIYILVAAPLRHLAEQWKREALAFGFHPVMCFSDHPNWPNDFSSAISAVNNKTLTVVMLIVVNATLETPRFQSMCEAISGNFLLIGDEMHNLGSPKLLKCLLVSANYRMGLSATPVRKYDEEGTNALLAYFGETVINYGIKEAIVDGTLVPYRYYPTLIEFNDEEMDEYRELCRKISLAYISGGDIDENDHLRNLLIRRSRLISNANGKLPRLKMLLHIRKESSFNLIYVGDGYHGDEKQVDAVLRIIGKELSMRTRKFTANESITEREEILDRFTSGDLQVIVAIRCLDEGVDIPRTETAYILASSSNPRQFIQRRGRVLRRAQGKKYATIVDFIVIPPLGNLTEWQEDESFELERKLVKRELERISEFAAAASNEGEALNSIIHIQKKLRILEV